MHTPRHGTGSSGGTRSLPEEYNSPPPPRCCQKRMYLMEYGILVGLQLLCFILDIVIWIVGAYSVYEILRWLGHSILVASPILPKNYTLTVVYDRIAAFCLIFVLHCLLLLPAIFLPLLVTRCALWLKRLRDWEVFHKYDWNIAVSYVTIISTVISLLLVLFCQPLFFSWTHKTTLVRNQPSYESMRSFSSFQFDSTFALNVTMMGEKISYPVGDPNGAGIYYNCFAPIVKAGTTGPNLFWAVCPWQKAPCASTLQDRSSCVYSWLSNVQAGVAWSSDIEYMLHAAIDEQTKLWKMPSPPPHYLVIHWENVQKTYKEAFTIWWATLLAGNVLIIIWWILRRHFLRCFCGTAEPTEYSILN